MKILIVVDMQKDFIDGALGTPEAVKIVPYVKALIEGFEGKVLFTRDTHFENYMDTREGKNLPFPHCIDCFYCSTCTFCPCKSYPVFFRDFQLSLFCHLYHGLQVQNDTWYYMLYSLQHKIPMYCNGLYAYIPLWDVRAP